MDLRRSKRIPQVPPQNDQWVDIARMLVEFDASVHEEVGGRSITMLNLIPFTREDKIPVLGFFHLLHENSYTDFDSALNRGDSAALNAIKTKESAVDCLKFLRRTGLGFERLLPDGRCLLHLGAEFCWESEVLEYLCSVCPKDYINHQDIRGWTPLHYAIFTTFQPRVPDRTGLAIMRCIVEHGADPYIKASNHALFCGRMQVDATEFTAFELGQALRSDLYQEFICMLKDNGREVPPEFEADAFYDTQEGIGL